MCSIKLYKFISAKHQAHQCVLLYLRRFSIAKSAGKANKSLKAGTESYKTDYSHKSTSCCWVKFSLPWAEKGTCAGNVGQQQQETFGTGMTKWHSGFNQTAGTINSHDVLPSTWPQLKSHSGSLCVQTSTKRGISVMLDSLWRFSNRIVVKRATNNRRWTSCVQLWNACAAIASVQPTLVKSQLKHVHVHYILVYPNTTQRLISRAPLITHIYIRFKLDGLSAAWRHSCLTTKTKSAQTRRMTHLWRT